MHVHPVHQINQSIKTHRTDSNILHACDEIKEKKKTKNATFIVHAAQDGVDLIYQIYIYIYKTIDHTAVFVHVTKEKKKKKRQL